MLKKIKESIKLSKLVKENMRVNERILQVEGLYLGRYPSDEIYQAIYDEGLHYDLYVRLTEELYDIVLEEASCMLRLEEMDRYKQQIAYLDQIGDEIVKIKKLAA